MSPPHPLTNFEIEKYFEDELLFNGVFSRNNLPRITQDGGYVVNLDDKGKSGTHWVAIFINDDRATYFDSFGVEHLPKEVVKFLRGKDLNVNIFRLQPAQSVLCGYYCLKFLDFMFDGKSLTDFTSMFSPTNFLVNDRLLLRLFEIDQ